MRTESIRASFRRVIGDILRGRLGAAFVVRLTYWIRIFSFRDDGFYVFSEGRGLICGWLEVGGFRGCEG